MVTRLQEWVISNGSHASSKPSFKDMVKNPTRPSSSQPTSLIATYILEKTKQKPQLEMYDLAILDTHNAYSSKAIICISNGY